MADFERGEPSLFVNDIRNKLTPITTLISLLERGVDGEMLEKSIKQAKESVNYLAQRDVYGKNK